MKKFLKALVSIMLIFATGCSSKTVKTSNSTKESSAKTFDGNYYNMINNGRSKNSEKFYLNFSNTKDLVTIGSGLQILSTKHFSTNDYYLSEGLQLTPTDYNNLLKRDAAGTKEEDKKYPDTLQIESGKTYEGLQSPVLVSNITEQDYYKKSGSSYALKGISVAIILDPKEQIDGKLSSPAITLSDEKLRSYAQQCVKKAYKYIRSKKKKLADVPVMVGIYRANNNEISETNGNYIYESFCEGGSVGTLKNVNHENVYFTSTRATKLDPATASEFATIKSNLKKASTEAAGLVGQANYIDDTIQTMKITAHLNIKTYTELLYLTSVIADNINSKFTQDFNIKVLVYSQDELMAVIIKQKGEDAKTSILEQ